MNRYRFVDQRPDPDPGRSREWLDSLDDLTAARGTGESRDVLFRVLGRADDLGIGLSQVGVTDYVNTIPAADEPSMPGDEEMEHRIRRLIRWNAAVMVSRANLRRHRRPSRHLRIGCDALRGGLQPLLPRQGRWWFR